MKKTIQIPTLFEQYQEKTKPTQESNLIANLFSDIEREIEKSRQDSIKVLNDIIARIPQILDELDALVVKTQSNPKWVQVPDYMNVIMSKSPRIKLITIQEGKGINSLFNLRIYLSAAEIDPTLRGGAGGFYESTRHIVEFGVSFTSLFLGFEDLSREERIERFEQVLKNDKFFYTFIHEMQHARDIPSLYRHFQVMFLKDKPIDRIAFAKIQQVVQTALEDKNKSKLSFFAEFHSNPSKYLKKDLQHSLKYLFEDYQEQSQLATTIYNRLNDPDLPIEDRLDPDEKALVQKRYLSISGIIEETISSVLNAIQDFSQNKPIQKLDIEHITQVRNIQPKLLVGQNYFDLFYYLTWMLLTDFTNNFHDDVLTTIFHMTSKKSNIVSSFIKEKLNLYQVQLPLITYVLNDWEVLAYRLNDVETVISHALLNTPLESAAFFTGTTFFAVTQSKMKYLLQNDLKDSLFKPYVEDKYNTSVGFSRSLELNGFSKELYTQALTEIFEQIKTLPQQNTQGSIFDMSQYAQHRTDPQKKASIFVEKELSKCLSTFRANVFKEIISKIMHIFLDHNIYTKAFFAQFKDIFCDALFDALQERESFKHTYELYHNIYQQTSQNKQAILDSLNFKDKHIALTRYSMLYNMQLSHIHFTVRRGLESIANRNILLNPKQKKINQYLVKDMSTSDLTMLKNILSVEIDRVSQQVSHKVQETHTLLNMQIKDYLQMNQHSKDAQNFVLDILALIKQTTQTILRIYKQTLVNNTTTEPYHLYKEFNAQIEPIFSNLYDILVTANFTQKTPYMYTNKRNEEILSTFNQIINQHFSKKDFVDMHQVLLFDNVELQNVYESKFKGMSSLPKYLDPDDNTSLVVEKLTNFMNFIERFVYAIQYSDLVSEKSQLEALMCLVAYFSIIHNVYEDILEQAQ